MGVNMVQRSNTPGHGHGSARVLSPSPPWCGGGMVLPVYIYVYACILKYIYIWSLKGSMYLVNARLVVTNAANS